MSWLITSGSQSTRASTSASVLPVNIQGWFPLELSSWISLQSKGLSRAFSSTTIQKHQFFSTQPSLWFISHIHTCLLKKPLALTIQPFVHKVMSLIFNTLSRSVIAFLPRSKRLIFLWLQSLSALLLEPKKMKSVTVSIFSSSICHLVMGLDFILAFWMLSWKPAFSLSFFTFIKKLFSSSSLSAIRVVSSAYLKLLIFIPIVLIPACESSSLAFHIMYSGYKLNKQGDNIQSWHTTFPILNQSIVPCLVLFIITVAASSAYSFSGDRKGGPIFPALRIFHSLLWSTQRL